MGRSERHDTVEQQCRADNSGGMLYVPFPRWASNIFSATLVAAAARGLTASQVALIALSSWLEDQGYLTSPSSTEPAAPSLDADLERKLWAALRCAITGADASTKRAKDDAFQSILEILRPLLNATINSAISSAEG